MTQQELEKSSDVLPKYCAEPLMPEIISNIFSLFCFSNEYVMCMMKNLKKL